MSSPASPLSAAHIESRQRDLIARATSQRRTTTLDAIDLTRHGVVSFHNAFWLVPQAKRARAGWFEGLEPRHAYTFDIDFDTLFLKPGELILEDGRHPTEEALRARGVEHVEPVIIRW